MQEATAERRSRHQPETIRISGFIVKTRYGSYHHTTLDPRVESNGLGDMFIAEHVIEIDAPAEFDPIAAEVQTIKTQLLRGRQVHAEHENTLLARLAKLEGAQQAPTAGAAS